MSGIDIDIDILIRGLKDLDCNSIEGKLISAYIEYNCKHHNYYNLINDENNQEILADIKFLFQIYSLEAKNDLVKHNIVNINEYTPEFLTFILAYIDNRIEPEDYNHIYQEAIQKLVQNEDMDMSN